MYCITMNKSYLHNSLIKSINNRLSKSDISHELSKILHDIYFVDLEKIKEKIFVFNYEFINEIKVIYIVDNNVSENFEFVNIDYDNKSVCIKLYLSDIPEKHTFFTTSYYLTYSVIYEIYNIMSEKNTKNEYVSNYSLFDDIDKLLDDTEYNIRILASENNWNNLDNIDYEKFADGILDIYKEYVDIIENNTDNLCTRKLKTIFENCISLNFRDIFKYEYSVLDIYIPVEIS